MSVQSFTPGNSIQETVNISVSDSAIQHFVNKLQENQQAQGVRISVKPSGCSGYMYVLDYVEKADSNDAQIALSNNVSLFVDKTSLPMLNGTQIDFVKQGLNANIQFKNPNVTGECGCGESFTVN